MRNRDLAELLMENPNAVPMLKVSDEWVEVRGVEPTGEHRNGVTFSVTELALDGEKD